MRNNIPIRRWATRGDEEIEGPNDLYGHDPSSEAIGGYYGIAWYEYFKDSAGEVYRVQCYDGTNCSKDAYEDEEDE